MTDAEGTDSKPTASPARVMMRSLSFYDVLLSMALLSNVWPFVANRDRPKHPMATTAVVKLLSGFQRGPLMNGMELHIGWSDISLRLVLTVLAGLLIGYNRSEHGKAAGLRTTVLVCLAASVAMIQMNLLLPTAGRSSDSFVMNDLMRLPLGILTGVGFIGGGVILRRDNIIIGVTTAATLWCVTVIGLCIGGGQLELGIAVTAVAVLALWFLQWIEMTLRREHRASLRLKLSGSDLSEDDIRNMLAAAGLKIAGVHIAISDAGALRDFTFDILEFSRPTEIRSPAIFETVAARKDVLLIEWKRV
jgi:putative Mg2+ transporter-C (MgtC) family protein